ncbi:hypothetical protein CEN46_20305 [Fischerella thermalis CCMEE 5318]|uniref:Uncharacterized protein n=1 Tax=Fischerella thermalis CCMEE 5318 TaxID=2019666 RepID=A0A2N6L954_9CYAN|nr:hypothetical protein CEN46_20305 [Fischerella thermalis CCMEE 5318]
MSLSGSLLLEFVVKCVPKEEIYTKSEISNPKKIAITLHKTQETNCIYRNKVQKAKSINIQILNSKENNYD